MLKHAAFMSCLVLFLASPASAFEDEPATAPDPAELVGRWLLAGFEVDGEPMEDDDLGVREIVLTEDGRMEAWVEEEQDDGGWYEIESPGVLRMYEDTNENGELDPKERDGAQAYAWSREEDLLTLTLVTEEGVGETLVVYLEWVEVFEDE